jgi:hypothetical protein
VLGGLTKDAFSTHRWSWIVQMMIAQNQESSTFVSTSVHCGRNRSRILEFIKKIHPVLVPNRKIVFNIENIVIENINCYRKWISFRVGAWYDSLMALINQVFIRIFSLKKQHIKKNI